jgi:hypothetical protein
MQFNGPKKPGELCSEFPERTVVGMIAFWQSTSFEPACPSEIDYQISDDRELLRYTPGSGIVCGNSVLVVRW